MAENAKWHNEMGFYASKNTALCDKLVLDQMPGNRQWRGGRITDELRLGMGTYLSGRDEIDQIENRKRIGGVQMNTERKCSLKQIGIENVFQRWFRVAASVIRNVRTLLSVLF